MKEFFVQMASDTGVGVTVPCLHATPLKAGVNPASAICLNACFPDVALYIRLRWKVTLNIMQLEPETGITRHILKKITDALKRHNVHVALSRVQLRARRDARQMTCNLYYHLSPNKKINMCSIIRDMFKVFRERWRLYRIVARPAYYCLAGRQCIQRKSKRKRRWKVHPLLHKRQTRWANAMFVNELSAFGEKFKRYPWLTREQFIH